MKKKIILVFQILFFILILFLLYKELKNYNIREIIKVLKNYRVSVVFLGIIIAGLNYLILTLYDFLALKNEGENIPLKKVIPISFTAFAFGNSLGFSGVSSTAIRLRLYGTLKIPERKIIKISLFAMISFWVGLALTGAVSGLINKSLYVIPLFILLGLYFWRIPKMKKISIKRSIILRQFLVGFLDWVVASLVLYLFLPVKPDFFLFLEVFCLAQLAGVISNLPGGLGTFEYVFMSLLGTNGGIVAALFIYRVIYYFIPLLGAVVTYITLEFTSKAEKIAKTYEFLIPSFLAVFSFACGTVLLISGSIPPELGRIILLRKIIPLGVLEASHFLGSVAGVALILLSYAIKNRINLAYKFTIAALILGIFSSLFKSINIEAAIFLLISLLLIIPSKKFFYRKSSIFHNKISMDWVVPIVMVLLSSIWLGFFSYKKTNYSDLLWWQFEFQKNAPRVLRTIFAVGIFTFIFSIIKILRPLPSEKFFLLKDVDSEVRDIMKYSTDSESNLVYLDDKKIYLNESKEAFLMYGKSQNTRVVMGDPIGKKDEIAEIIWDFFLEAKQSLEQLIFYEVGKEHLNYYLDIGMTIFKIGEEALVPLDTFSLEGDKKKSLRHTYNKLTRDQYILEIIKKEDVEQYLDELERISDLWLKTKKVKEKGFSLGNFSREYLRKFDVAIIRRDEKIYAFANLFLSGTKDEISIDLMRYDIDEAPNGVMDYLFIKLMEYGKAEGYKKFNMGMAPLSGIENKNTGLNNLWNKASIFIYKYGSHFYNFEGLRKFKNKFGPEWEPKYIAFYGNPFKILKDTISLISGGVKGFLKK